MFDVIISNPPYQLATGGGKAQAIPIYQRFVELAKSLNPKYISMIIPSRWFAGGMNLDEFRTAMMNDRQITKMVDYVNSKSLFPDNSVGGACYFLWEKGADADCEFTSIKGDSVSTMARSLAEFPILVRYNEAASILRKVETGAQEFLSSIASPLNPFSINSNIRGADFPDADHAIGLYSSDGLSYISPSAISKGTELVGKYKVMVSKTASEHAGESSKDGMFRVLTRNLRVLQPNEVCTFSYFIIGGYNNPLEPENLLAYLKTKFVRFLVLQAMSSINLTRASFMFVPLLDFGRAYTDADLYVKYNLSDVEIEFIESIIRPMDINKE